MCELGSYSTTFTVLNLSGKSHRHHNQLVGLGSFGKIYQCQQLGPEVSSVVKCLNFESEDSARLMSHIKEFFFYDLFSALEIGPPVARKNGFDFILFEDCLEF